MSHSQTSQGVTNASAGADDAEQQTGDGEAEVVTIPASSALRQHTGDDVVDAALAQLDAVSAEPLDSQIQVGEQVHRVLQGRLGVLGKE